MRLFTPATKTTTIRVIRTKRFLTHHVLSTTRLSTTTTRITTNHHGSHTRPYSSEKGTPPSPLSSQSQPQSQSTFNPETYLQTATTTLSLIPPKLIPDTLHPTQSHLLSLALSSHLPSICLPQGFNAQPPSPTNKSIFPWPSQENNNQLLPPGYHLIYYPLQTPPHLLFPDGTDADHCPGSPFTRRMWAGGRIDFGKGGGSDDQQQQLFKVDGRKTVCVETLGTPVLQLVGGNSGKKEQEQQQDQKVYVDVWRRYIAFPPEATSREIERVVADVIKNTSSSSSSSAPGECKEEGVISELRRLVFLRERRPDDDDDDDKRSDPFPSPSPNPNDPKQKLEPKPKPVPAPARIIRVPHQPDFSFTMTPDATLLFQFSALTFNAHAIHLDPLYAREVEGYKERLVHGPLTLVIMLRGVEGFLNAVAAAGTGVDTTTTTTAADSSVGIGTGTTGVSEVIKERLLFVPPPGEEEEETADGKKRKKRWEIASIEYKNLRPLFVGEEMKVCVRLLPNREKKKSSDGGDRAGLGLSLGAARSERVDVWIEAPDGGLAVKGTVGIEWR